MAGTGGTTSLYRSDEEDQGRYELDRGNLRLPAEGLEGITELQMLGDQGK